jgi:hypothetical protein
MEKHLFISRKDSFVPKKGAFILSNHTQNKLSLSSFPPEMIEPSLEWIKHSQKDLFFPPDPDEIIFSGDEESFL